MLPFWLGNLMLPLMEIYGYKKIKAILSVKVRINLLGIEPWVCGYGNITLLFYGIIVAFRCGESPGTTNMINIAKKHGLITVVCDFPAK